MKNDGFFMFSSIYDAAQNLPDEQRLKFYDAIFRNRFDGANLESDDQIVAFGLQLIAPTLEKQDRGAEAGRKGAERRWQRGASSTADAEQKEPEKHPNDDPNGSPNKVPNGVPNSTPMSTPNTTRDKGQGIKDKGLYVSDNAPARVRETSQDPEEVETAENVVDTVDKPKRQTFKPPTTADVYEYAEEAGLQIDAEAFCDFYASKNWMVGRTKMKDWKAAARNWARRDQEDRNRENARADSFRPHTVFHGMENRRESYETLIPSKYA